jgi:hypothetical protein
LQELSKDVVALLQYLVPGFLVAWVYYGFCPQAKPSQFERVVQALVFTVIVQVLVRAERVFFEWCGSVVNLGAWTADSTIFASLITALAAGFGIAASTKHDFMHKVARNCGLTTRSGYPNEHYGAFAESQDWVVLQLKDGTRLFGWPLRWPTEGDKGHYLLTDVERAYVDRPSDPPEDLSMLQAILVPAGEVRIVEFVK